jgi:hypothetical protein
LRIFSGEDGAVRNFHPLPRLVQDTVQKTLHAYRVLEFQHPSKRGIFECINATTPYASIIYTCRFPIEPEFYP